MAMYSSRLNLSHLHKTTVGKHWIKIYAPSKGRNFPITLIMRIGLFFLILFVVLSIVRQYYPSSTHSLLSWVPNLQFLDFFGKKINEESLMTETLNPIQTPKDNLSLMTLSAEPQNGTQENQESQPDFNSETSTTAQQRHEKPMVENIKREEQLNEGSYLKVSSSSLNEDSENELFELEKQPNANVQTPPSEVKEIQTVKTQGGDGETHSKETTSSASLQPLEIVPPSESPIVPKSPSTTHQKIVALLQQCEIHFNANRLTTGHGGTAFDCYNKVLALEPNNGSAKRGLKKIEARYQQWLELSIQQQNWQNARIYLERLRQLNPNASALSKFPKGALEQSSNPQPASSSKTPVQNKNLTVLLAQCEAHLKAHRLTTGKGGTAFDCYHQVLAVDPNNQTAKTGLKKIESRYEYWAERALSKGKWQSARKHINRLRHVHPNSPALPKLLERLKTVKLKWQQHTSTTKRLASQPAYPNDSQQKRRQPTDAAPTKSLSSKPTKPTLTKSLSQNRSKPAPTKSRTPKRSKPIPKKSRTLKRCGDILAQESLGIRPLTGLQRAFKRQYCN